MSSLPESASRETGRLRFLDVTRGLAALAVMADHSAELLWPAARDFGHYAFSAGKFGVVLFFLTSGFVIPFSLERSGSLRHFAISRVFRLYPAYVLSVVAFVGLLAVGFRDGIEPVATVHLARNALVNLTMLQEFVRVPDLRGHYYTLAIEIVFYTLCALLFRLHVLRRSTVIVYCFVLLLLLGGIVAPVVLERRLPLAGMFYLTSMFVGTLLFRHFSGRVSAARVLRLLSTLAVVTALAIALNYVIYKKGDPDDQFGYFAVAAPWAAAYAFFIGAYLLRSRAMPAALVWLGTISYSVYLFHPALLTVMHHLFPPLGAFFATLAATAALAYVIYRFVEYPCIRFSRRLSERYEIRSAAPGAAAGLSIT